MSLPPTASRIDMCGNRVGPTRASARLPSSPAVTSAPNTKKLSSYGSRFLLTRRLVAVGLQRVFSANRRSCVRPCSRYIKSGLRRRPACRMASSTPPAKKFGAFIAPNLAAKAGTGIRCL